MRKGRLGADLSTFNRGSKAFVGGRAGNTSLCFVGAGLKPNPVCLDLTLMTNVEALLTVESGRVPEGVHVFVEQNPETGRLRGWLFLCAFLALVAALTGLQGGNPWGVFAIALFASMAGVMAIPTQPEEPWKPRVLLLCQKGLIVREHWGLRNWRYEELSRPYLLFVDGEQQLCLEAKDGEIHLIDHLSYRHGACLRDLLEQRIRGS